MSSPYVVLGLSNLGWNAQFANLRLWSDVLDTQTLAQTIQRVQKVTRGESTRVHGIFEQGKISEGPVVILIGLTPHYICPNPRARKNKG